MSVRKYSGSRGVRWQIVIETGIDSATGKRKQEVIRRDPETGLSISTKRRAQEIERELLVQRHHGGRPEPDKTLLRDYLPRWLDETRGSRADSTNYHWGIVIRVRLIPSIGHIPLGKLTGLDIHTMYREHATRYAPRSLEATRRVLYGSLKQAVAWGLIPTNPAVDISLPVRADSPNREVWTAEETRAFLVATRDSDWAALWRLLLDVGCRIGEALALRWPDVDLEAGCVSIHRTVSINASGSFIIVDRTKTRSGRRTVTISPDTVAALRRWRQQQRERRIAWGDIWLAGDLVFDRADRGDGSILNPGLARKLLDRDAAAAGVPRLTPHGLRRTNITLAAAAGEPLYAIAKRVGHAKIAMTADLYAQHDQVADRAISDTLQRLLGS